LLDNILDSSQDSKSNSDDEESNKKGHDQAESSEDDSIQDLANKSIDSGPSELQEIVDPNNYLPFISDRFELRNDVLEEIDRNERSFKIIAEKMIQKSSQLELPAGHEENH
jgi:hypothetical protein